MTSSICLEMDAELQQGFPSSLGSPPDGSLLLSALQLAAAPQGIPPSLNAKTVVTGLDEDGGTCFLLLTHPGLRRCISGLHM